MERKLLSLETRRKNETTSRQVWVNGDEINYIEKETNMKKWVLEGQVTV